jgi:hypothetical protein
VGETRVDLLHLLEDLRDAYPGSLEETTVSEIVANALDSGATTVAFATDAAARTLTVLDNGSGMSRAELRRYHDLAASTKARGKGIGFAGVGIKLGLLACEEVLTESRRGTSHVATRWQLGSRHRAPWKWTLPPGLVGERGTAVRLVLNNALSPLLDPGFLTATLRHHFAPLLDPAFATMLAGHYPQGVRLVVNGAGVTAEDEPGERATIGVRVGRQRKPSASGYLVLCHEPLPDDRRGVAVSTLGKVIKRGWDWLGLTPAAADRVTGLIEAPPLASALTLTKGDFLRSGRAGALYLAYRKALQEAVGAQLAAWGDERSPAHDARSAKRRPMERLLRGVLADLAEDYPLLATLVDWAHGGQRQLPIGGRGRTAAAFGAAATEPQPLSGESDPTPESGAPDQHAPDTAAAEVSGGAGARRPAHAGLTVEFESRPGEPALGRLVESTVWVNDAHPAFRRAAATRAGDYHVALTVALTLAPLAVEAGQILQFVTMFLERWGAANGTERGHGVTRRRRRG